jgi:hypothetical protein
MNAGDTVAPWTPEPYVEMRYHRSVHLIEWVDAASLSAVGAPVQERVAARGLSVVDKGIGR